MQTGTSVGDSRHREWVSSHLSEEVVMGQRQTWHTLPVPPCPGTPPKRHLSFKKLCFPSGSTIW